MTKKPMLNRALLDIAAPDIFNADYTDEASRVVIYEIGPDGWEESCFPSLLLQRRRPMTISAPTSGEVSNLLDQFNELHVRFA
jgi:hypothetical protein